MNEIEQQVTNEWIERMKNPPKGAMDVERAKACLERLFDYTRKSEPNLPRLPYVVATSPRDVRDRQKLAGVEHTLYGCGAYGWYSLTADADASLRQGKLNDKPDIKMLAETLRELLVEARCWHAAYGDNKTVYLIPWPTEVHIENGQLHRADGPAMAWADGCEIWATNGVVMLTAAARDPESVTLERLVAIRNADIRRATLQKLGWEWLVRRAGEPVSTETDPNTGLRYRLFRPQMQGFRGALLEMQSPLQNNGETYYHVEVVDGGVQSACAARTWRVPNSAGAYLTAAQANEAARKNPWPQYRGGEY